AQGRFSLAIAEVDRAIACLPALAAEVAGSEQSKPYLLKARILAGQKKLEAAESVLTAALATGDRRLDLLLDRAKIRQLRANQSGAREDRAEALRLEPKDEIGWNVRGLGRLAA